MYKYSKVTALAIVLLLAVLTWLKRDQFSLPLPQQPQAGSQESKPSKLARPEIADLSNTVAGQAQDEAEDVGIPGEAVLSFDDKTAFEQFRNAARANGFKILAIDDRLLSIRLRHDESKSLESIRNSGADIDSNYTLLTPFPINFLLDGQEAVFAGSALDFIRAPQDTSNLGKGIKIAILDSGIGDHDTLSETNVEHVELSEIENGTDLNPHGTAVASIIGGKQGMGIAPASDLLSIRVLDTEGIGDTFSLAQGIVAAVDAGASIINMSVGSYGTNQALDRAVSYAESKGVVLVAAVGNEGATLLPFPAAYDTVIAATAIDANGHPSSFANQNPGVDIAAPGVGVHSAWDEGNLISFSGTSAAAPYVSGAIAAISSERGITPVEAAGILLENANDSGLPGRDPQLGRGYIDLQRSLVSDTNYTDLALADIFLDPRPNDNEEYDVHLTVQNRGTQNIPVSNLSYTLPSGSTQTVGLGSIPPNETRSHRLSFNAFELSQEGGITLDAKVSLSSSSQDKISENNARAAEFFALPEE